MSITDFFLGKQNVDKLAELEGQYMSQFPQFMDASQGAAGVFSDARHAAATQLMSDRLGGGVIGDTLANIGGFAREVPTLVSEALGLTPRGQSFEDIVANAAAFNYPTGTSAEDIYADVFSKAQVAQAATKPGAGMGYNYGQAQANPMTDGQINLPGEATAYLLSRASKSIPSGSTSKISVPSSTAPATAGGIVDVAAVQDAIARARQREADAAVSNRFADFAPQVGLPGQATFGEQLIESRQPRNLIGRDPMAQFEEESRSTGSFDEMYDTFRDNLRPPSKIDEGLATLLSLAGLVTGSTPIKVLGAGANIASGKAGRILGGIKGFNQKLQQSDFGQSKSLADFLNKRRQRNEAASKKTRDEAREITRRLSKQKVSPRDDRRGSTPTRTSKPSTSRRSSSSYTEASRARRR